MIGIRLAVQRPHEMTSWLAVLAYGQTGSGKTYTMGSAFTPGGNTEGVIPKVMDGIFQRIATSKDAEYTVRVGFVEIHKVDLKRQVA